MLARYFFNLMKLTLSLIDVLFYLINISHNLVFLTLLRNEEIQMLYCNIILLKFLPFFRILIKVCFYLIVLG